MMKSITQYTPEYEMQHFLSLRNHNFHFKAFYRYFRIDSVSSAAYTAPTRSANIKHIILPALYSCRNPAWLWHNLVVCTSVHWTAHSYVTSAANNWCK